MRGNKKINISTTPGGNSKLFGEGEKSTIMFESMGDQTAINSPEKIEKRDRLFKKISEEKTK